MKTSEHGFTIMEMLVVLVIIGLIVGLVGPQLFSTADRSKVQMADTQIKMLRNGLETMRLDIGRFPTSQEGLQLLNNAPSDSQLAQFWKGPYLSDSVPLDPWNNPYQYSQTAAGNSPVTLYSYGADGRPGGEGIDEDIGFLPQ